MVDNKFIREYYELDKTKKTKEWGNTIVSYLRLLMNKPIYSAVAAKENREYLNGLQPMEKHQKKFRNPSELPFEFHNLGLAEKFRNILTAEIEKAGIYINLKSIDPSIKDDRKNDMDLLKSKSRIEGTMSYIQNSIGLPNYNLSEDTRDDGKKLNKGNMNQFFDLGLDTTKEDDIQYFFKTFFRLNTEIQGEEIINYFVKNNDLEEIKKYWADDILAIKCISGRAYCNELTLMPTYKYLRPENVYAIRGKRRDGKDDKAKMILENLTVNEALERMGAELTDEVILEILTSVNWRNSQAYDGVDYGDFTYPEKCDNAIPLSRFMNMYVSTGYIEYKSVNNESKKEGLNKNGNFRSIPISPNSQIDKTSKYKKATKKYQTTYKTYFIAKSSNQQILFNFGELVDMPVYGADDEYSGFSIFTYIQPGPSAIDICKPHIDTIHDSYFRSCWILNKTKPKGTRYNYKVLAKTAVQMYKHESLTEFSAVMKYIKDFADSIDDFYSNDDANPNLGGGQNPHFEKANGIDKVLFDLYTVIQNEKLEMSDKLGINSIREAYSPSPNDGYKLQMETLAQSRNATDYISRMLMAILQHFAQYTLQNVQDLLALFPKRARTILESALGKEAVECMDALDQIGIHKFGIFIDTFNTDIQRKQEQQNAFTAWQAKEITYATYLLITNIDNWKRAAQILAYEKAKELRIQQEQQLQLEQEKRLTMQKQQEQLRETAGLNGAIKLGQIKEENKGLKDVAMINRGTEIIKKRLSAEAEPVKAQAKADGKLKEKAGEKDLDRQNNIADAVT